LPEGEPCRIREEGGEDREKGGALRREEGERAEMQVRMIKELPRREGGCSVSEGGTREEVVTSLNLISLDGGEEDSKRAEGPALTKLGGFQ
jgi:hypothetical protein